LQNVGPYWFWPSQFYMDMSDMPRQQVNAYMDKTKSTSNGATYFGFFR
jgi:hypothetical protein